MKEYLEDQEYDTRLWPSDWRYSAAIVGLLRYFKNRNINFNMTDDYIEYNQSDIIGEDSKQNYLLFAEYYFSDGMHHKFIEKLLSYDSISDEQQKLLNEKLKANSICKKIFGKIKYPDASKDELKDIIEGNRLDLIQETFRGGKTMYAKFANTNKLFSSGDKVSRLNGYYVDLPKKSKSIAYKWDYNTFVANDEPEFDFIVFAFTKTREGFFINNNYSIDRLYRTNENLQDKLIEEAEDRQRNPRTLIFTSMKESSTFIDYNVEVIIKSQDSDYYETMFIRDEAIKIFKEISDNRYNMLTLPCRMDNGEYIQCEKIVTESILNHIHLDIIIERLLRDKTKKIGLIFNLIYINEKIYGGKNMEVKSYKAKQTAEEVVKSLKRKNAKNKITSYRQKLISAICFKDYDKYCDILMNLSSYSEIPFEFAYDLFDDFDKNKNIAYAFANALYEETNTKNNEVKEEGK